MLEICRSGDSKNGLLQMFDTLSNINLNTYIIPILNNKPHYNTLFLLGKLQKRPKLVDLAKIFLKNFLKTYKFSCQDRHRI